MKPQIPSQNQLREAGSPKLSLPQPIAMQPGRAVPKLDEDHLEH